MGTSKILIDGVGIDLTQDTVAANKMLSGIKAHDSNGDSVTGSIQTWAGQQKSGVKNITANGTFDVSEFASAAVSVKDYIIPAEYEELAYIEASGTQWIDSEVIPTQHNFVHAKIMLNGGTNSSYYPFVAAPPHVYALQFNGEYKLTPCWSIYSVGNTYLCCYITRGDVYEVYSSSCIKRSTAFVVEPVEGVFPENHSDNSDNITPTVAFGIFARKNENGTSSYNISGRIYWLEISNENGLVAKFIPVMRKSDSVIGLYDVIRSRFFTNKGSGTFAGGTLT